MIGYLAGKLLHKHPPLLLLDVNGVGYELEASMNTFYKLPAVGQALMLYTHLVVREDAHLIYGFSDETERKLFRTLIKVNGVGPKLALTILSSMEPDGFVQAIQENNITSLVRIPGIGKKTAERMVIEMRDRLQDWQPITTDATILTSNKVLMAESPSEEAISALIALGYKPQEASLAIKQVAEPNLTSEILIRMALKKMMR